MLSPNDEARLLIGLLNRGGTELARRWLAALMLVPEDEREAAVEAIERKVSALYGEAHPVPPLRKNSDRRRSATPGEAMDRLRRQRTK